jgi:membrane protease YdiL (CAAX protease family)
MVSLGVALGTLAAALVLGGGLAHGDRRRLLWGFAAASVPLAAGLWINLVSVPSLGSGTAKLAAGALRSKLQLIAVAGLLPALLAWAAVRTTEPGRRVASGTETGSRTQRMAWGAAVTLATVVAAGGSVAFLAALGADGPPVEGLWSGASPALVLGLSLVAAVAEELLFRGTLFPGLAPRLGWRGSGALQAGLFGLLHAGYGDPGYVAAAAAFGCVQAAVTRRWGLGVAVLVHAQVNVVILGWAARAVSPANAALVLGVLGMNLILTAGALQGWVDPADDGGAAAGA